MKKINYFPKSYDDSRCSFLKAVAEIEGEQSVFKWKIPCDTDSALIVDSVYLPPTGFKKRLVILISGTHGLEGYAGSAVQQLFINEYLNKIDRSETGFLIVHSLNPFGFKYHRRGTETGVNLNRNCSIHASFFEAPNQRSIEFSNRFIPTQAVNAETSYLLKRMTGTKESDVCFDDITLDEFVKVVGLGQFATPKGLEFGGKQPEPQIAALITLLNELIPQYKDIIHLDLHTGLGDRAHLHLLVDGQDEGLHLELFNELLNPQLDSDVYAFTDANVPGFYKTRGATNNLVAELVNSNQRACALTLEFGTLGHDLQAQLEALNSWMLEHQGSWYGYTNTDLENKIKEMYLERFFPADLNWREKILEVSGEFFKRIFTRCQIL